MFHVSLLIAAHPDTPVAKTWEWTSEDPVWEVEKILDSRIKTFGRKKHLQYYIKWRGYDEGSNTWEWEEDVENAPEMIKDFYKEHPEAPRLKRG